MSTIAEFFSDVWQTHKGLFTAAFIVFCFAFIGWASDEWEKKKRSGYWASDEWEKKKRNEAEETAKQERLEREQQARLEREQQARLEREQQARLEREQQARLEREQRQKQEEQERNAMWEVEREERRQTRLLERQVTSAARRARRKEMKAKNDDLAKLAMVETALPENKIPATTIDSILNQPTAKRLSRSFPLDDLSSIPDPSPASEGKRILKTNYAVVRNSTLRRIAILFHGRNCIVCGFNFDLAFGRELAQGYIEVHHLKSIARGERSTDPKKDLVPLCGNCHAMADRLASSLEFPPNSISELKRLLQSRAVPPHANATGEER